MAAAKRESEAEGKRRKAANGRRQAEPKVLIALLAGLDPDYAVAHVSDTEPPARRPRRLKPRKNGGAERPSES